MSGIRLAAPSDRAPRLTGRRTGHGQVTPPGAAEGEVTSGQLGRAEVSWCTVLTQSTSLCRHTEPTANYCVFIYYSLLNSM